MTFLNADPDMANMCAGTCVSTVLPLTRKGYLQAVGDGHQVKQECVGLACALAHEVEKYLSDEGAPQHVKDALTSMITRHTSKVADVRI